jgi:predicted phosphodiesterase
MAAVRVAALYDVHGNLPALEAVLADAGADVFLFGGDLVWGPWPRECLVRARGLGDRARFIMGNTDRAALDDDEDPSGLWVQERLDGEEQAFVRSWPATLVLDRVLYCHGTPRSDEEVVTPISPEERWEEALRGVEEETVVCGHIHFQYDERHAGRRVVNPGSVGRPTIRAAAWWAALDDGDVALQTTAYDVGAAAEAMRAGGFPRPDFADELLDVPTYERILPRWR